MLRQATTAYTREMVDCVAALSRQAGMQPQTDWFHLYDGDYSAFDLVLTRRDGVIDPSQRPTPWRMEELSPSAAGKGVMRHERNEIQEEKGWGRPCARSRVHSLPG